MASREKLLLSSFTYGSNIANMTDNGLTHDVKILTRENCILFMKKGNRGIS
jgi:hypothetical protein